ncbi:hypothetical protein JW998_14750 [candidate division KSB1 bacterium]|nr:hypothetical protein [candidate division KSB1 bacterium]
MFNRWILYMLSSIVLSSSGWQRLTAQQIVRPDSVVQIKDSTTGDVGFVIPKLIAIDYRNLLVHTLPLMEAQIDTLKLVIDKNRSIINNQKEEIGLLKSNVADAQQQFAAEHAIRLACEKEKAKLFWWKLGTGAFAATTAAMLVLYALK